MARGHAILLRHLIKKLLKSAAASHVPVPTSAAQQQNDPQPGAVAHIAKPAVSAAVIAADAVDQENQENQVTAIIVVSAVTVIPAMGSR